LELQDPDSYQYLYNEYYSYATLIYVFPIIKYNLAQCRDSASTSIDADTDISSVSDPDPDTIRSVPVDSNPDPDPGGQKRPTKIEKRTEMYVLKCCMFSFLRAESFFCSLDVFYGGLEINLQVLI
jgi:hypothetical protein